jgi:small GTP-binding protein
LGILAHVDAGKTTLTERLLYAAGVIDEIGSVDDGTTQTDSLALERQRGITIKAAVASFAIGNVAVNLIDTPGHPDFIAEVERALSVLDGAVLVISAVEGVQPQTRILMRALQRLHVPVVMFVNKIDRRGAGYDRLLRDISGRLTPAIVAMGSAHELGTHEAGFTEWDGSDPGFTARLTEVLAEHDEAIMAAYIRGEPVVSYPRLRAELAAQTGRGHVVPVYFGSALTGAGVDALMSGLPELLPTAGRDVDGPASGRVFKIERGAAGEKIAYVRMFSGTVRTRDRLRVGPGRARKVTAISVFGEGRDARCASVSAGQIGKLWGLAEIKVGDTVGTVPMQAQPRPPALQQGHVEHGRGLPEADAAGGDGRGPAGRDRGVRAGPPLPPGRPGGCARAAAGRAGPTARDPAYPVDARRLAGDGGRHPGGPRARPAAGTPGADPRRRRARMCLRPLRTRGRCGADAAAPGAQPVEPRGIPPAGRAPRDLTAGRRGRARKVHGWRVIVMAAGGRPWPSGSA